MLNQMGEAVSEGKLFQKCGCKTVSVHCPVDESVEMIDMF